MTRKSEDELRQSDGTLTILPAAKELLGGFALEKLFRLQFRVQGDERLHELPIPIAELPKLHAWLEDVLPRLGFLRTEAPTPRERERGN